MSHINQVVWAIEVWDPALKQWSILRFPRTIFETEEQARKEIKYRKHLEPDSVLRPVSYYRGHAYYGHYLAELERRIVALEAQLL